MHTAKITSLRLSHRPLCTSENPLTSKILKWYYSLLSLSKNILPQKKTVLRFRTSNLYRTSCNHSRNKMSTATVDSVENRVSVARKRKSNYLGLLLAGCCFSKKNRETEPECSRPEEQSLVQDVPDHALLIPDVRGSTESKVPETLNDVAGSLAGDTIDRQEVVTVPVIRKEKKNKQKKGNASGRRSSPNYFVAIQVDNPKIHDSLAEVQESIIQSKPIVKRALISLASLHITVVVIHIDQEEDLQRASEALNASFIKLKDDLKEKPLILTFQGLSNFNKKVLYADLKRDEGEERLQKLYEVVVSSFESHGFDGVRERDSFNAHLTIAKLSKAPELRRMGVKFISPSWYSDHSQTSFGSQVVKGLQLLSMVHPKDDKGYYHCDHECLFDVPATASNVVLESLLSMSSEDKEKVRAKIRQLATQKLQDGDTV